MRKFDNIENCVKYLGNEVLPIIKNLDCAKRLTLYIGCGEDDLWVDVNNYNKETNEISFDYTMTNVAENICIWDTFNCESVELFFNIVKSFLQEYCLENLYEGNCINADFSIIELCLGAYAHEDNEEYVEEESDLDAYLSEMADVYEDVNDEDLPF